MGRPGGKHLPRRLMNRPLGQGKIQGTRSRVEGDKRTELRQAASMLRRYVGRSHRRAQCIRRKRPAFRSLYSDRRSAFQWPSGTRLDFVGRGRVAAHHTGISDRQRSLTRSGISIATGETNGLHQYCRSVTWRSGRRREWLEPSSTSRRYLLHKLMCSQRAGGSRAVSSLITVLPSA
jgi:hypothetical protein